MKKLSILFIALVAMVNAQGQWAGPSEGTPIVTEGTSIYNNEAIVGADGTTYFIYYHPNIKEAEDEYDTDNVVYEYRLQAIDKNGERKFGDSGILISDYPNRSYCVVNNYIYIDKEGNIIVAVSDARDCPYGDLMSAYAYKISPEGEMLWGEDGVFLCKDSDLIAAMKIIGLADDSYVFSWMTMVSNNICSIELQRITSDGEPQWDADEVRLSDSNVTYQYPYLVDAGMNQCILVYAKGSAQDLYARKLDFDGSSVWGEDTRIYRGGWGSIPLWTLLDVKPSSDGGVIVGWNDDRYYTNVESAFMSYVTGDGKIGFSAASDEGDVKLGYSEFRQFNCKIQADPTGDGFFAFWRETNGGQSWQRMMMQKVSKQGELLYGDEGVIVVDFEELAFGYNSVQAGNDGEAALFFMRQNESWGNVDALFVLFNTETGDLLFEEPHRLTAGTMERSGLTSHVCMEEKFWILKWKEEYKNANNESVERHVLQRVDFDGNVYTSIEDINYADNDNFYFSNDQLIVNVTQDCHAQIEIFDLTGRKIDNISSKKLNAGLNTINWTNKPGIYIAKLNTNNEVMTCKILIK